MKTKDIEKTVRRAIKTGNWMVRTQPRDGKYYNGFRWGSIGEWTVAPDWNTDPVCGGGLHGQGPEAGGYVHYQDLSLVLFCETSGPRVIIDGNKIKVSRARILLFGLPDGLSFCGSLNLSCTGTITLSKDLEVGDSLDLSGTGITALPESLAVGGSLYLDGNKITALPEGLKVGGFIYR